MVLMSAPFSSDTSTWQERVSVPPRCTEQAPHCPIPQPYFVPLRSSTSRSTHRSGVSGATSTVVGFPLTLKLTIMRVALAVVG
jgi:hypothetical protein